MHAGAGRRRRVGLLVSGGPSYQVRFIITDLDLTLVHCDVKKREAVLEVAGMDGRPVVGSESGGAGHGRGWWPLVFSSSGQVRSGQVHYSAEVWDHESHTSFCHLPSNVT